MVELESGCSLALSLKGTKRASGLQQPTPATVRLAQGLRDGQGKKDHLLSMARVLMRSVNSLWVLYIPEQTGCFSVSAICLFLSCFTASVVIYLPICMLGNAYCYSQVLSNDKPAAGQAYRRNNLSLIEAEYLKQISPRPTILTRKRQVRVCLAWLTCSMWERAPFEVIPVGKLGVLEVWY